MSASPLSARAAHYRLRASHHLNDLIAEIELTLISVVTGVLLFVLADYGAVALRDSHLEYLPYIVANLILVGWFWTEVVGHSLVFVGWPIDIPHNLLYILYGTVLGIQEHFIGDPRNWLSVMLLATFVGLILVRYDLSLLDRRALEATGAGAELYQIGRWRQTRLLSRIGLTSAVVLITLALGAVAPDLMVARGGYLLVIVATSVASIYFLYQAVVTLGLIREKVLEVAAEELAQEDESRAAVLPKPGETPLSLSSR